MSRRPVAARPATVDGELGARWRRARREVGRRHHPDRGGDSATYLAAIAEVDRRFGMDAAAAPSGCRSRRRRVARALRRAVRAARAGLPRWVPGARRWIDL